MKIKKIYFLQILIAAAACIALASCATNGPVKTQDSSVIKQRSIERWNFLIEHQADKAYDYLSPGYRATKARDVYAKEMNGRGIRWTKVSFDSQDCKNETCKVQLFVDYKITMGGPAGTVNATGPIVETWIESGGKWYYLPESVQSSKLVEGSNP